MKDAAARLAGVAAGVRAAELGVRGPRLRLDVLRAAAEGPAWFDVASTCLYSASLDSDSSTRVEEQPRASASPSFEQKRSSSDNGSEASISFGAAFARDAHLGALGPLVGHLDALGLDPVGVLGRRHETEGFDVVRDLDLYASASNFGARQRWAVPRRAPRQQQRQR